MYLLCQGVINAMEGESSGIRDRKKSMCGEDGVQGVSLCGVCVHVCGCGEWACVCA